MNNLKDKLELNSDQLDDKIIPFEGSIKEIRIDGCLDTKHVYINGKWKNACRFKNCRIEINDKDTLCINHKVEYKNLQCIYRIQQLFNNKIIEHRYQWNSQKNEWILLCCIGLCNKNATKKDSKNTNYFKCIEHSKNKATYSTHQTVINLYNYLLKDYKNGSV